MSNTERVKDAGQGLNAAVAATLNAERVAAGYTFEGLADLSNISKRTLMRQLSTKERHIDIDDLATLAGVFGLTVSEVIGMAQARMDRPPPSEGRTSA